MTFLDKLKQDYPDIDEEEVENIINEYCPDRYGYEEKTECKHDRVLSDYCNKCWNREMPSEVQQAEPSCDDVKNAYEQGLEDASDAVIELVNLSAEELESVFKYSSFEFIVENVSMKNIIEKLKAYEESKITTKDVLESWKKTAIPKDDFEKEAYSIIENALEKQIPKKPILSKSMMTKKEFQICPVCERLVLYDGNKFNYCQYCGQKLDWNSEETR